MTQVANTYAQALYDLAKAEDLGSALLQELETLKGIFQDTPGYGKLLSAPDIPKAERRQLLDQAFQGKVHPYVLNFLKILTDKGYIRAFPLCCEAYRGFYNEDNGILVVQVLSAVPLTEDQKGRLIAKLTAITGKHIELCCAVDPAQLGGLQLRCDGKQVDGTVRSRLESLGKQLKNTVL